MTDKTDIKDEFESKKGKIRRNDWRKFISVVVAVIALYLINAYNILEHTGYVLGLMLVAMCGVVTNYIIDKIFFWFMD